MNRKVWIKTFGCQMNYHDSERIMFFLREIGLVATNDKTQADLILFNTCAVRALANQKFYSQLGETKKLCQLNKQLKIGILGCVSQIEGQQLLAKHSHLNFALGTDAIDQIVEVIHRLDAGEDKIFLNAFDKSSNYSIETRITHANPSAFVNIIKGCNNFCSYCIVPYTRGRESSRRLSEIVNDVTKLVECQGIQEVTLLGQNVNSFGKERGESLAQLIGELDKIDGLKLIRYTTSHPYDLSDELIEMHKIAKKLANHVHLPVQSGSDSVLQRMNRKYTINHFLQRMKKLQEANPEIVISSDIIVGFPNESEREFQETLDFLTRAQFDFIYSYRFSPRAGTVAAKMDDVLSDKIRRQRLVELQQHQMKLQEANRAKLVGKVLTVLVSGSNVKDGVHKWQGRSTCNRIVHFSQEGDYKWSWVNVQITSATALSLQGKLLSLA